MEFLSKSAKRSQLQSIPAGFSESQSTSVHCSRFQSKSMELSKSASRGWNSGEVGRARVDPMGIHRNRLDLSEVGCVSVNSLEIERGDMESMDL